MSRTGIPMIDLFNTLVVAEKSQGLDKNAVKILA
jgi:vacuolar-type H+-ATPase subunit B/Vma2